MPGRGGALSLGDRQVAASGDASPPGGLESTRDRVLAEFPRCCSFLLRARGPQRVSPCGNGHGCCPSGIVLVPEACRWQSCAVLEKQFLTLPNYSHARNYSIFKLKGYYGPDQTKSNEITKFQCTWNIPRF
ncbi:uncharacterized protein M6G45_009409 [Spheniscus humboldti]